MALSRYGLDVVLKYAVMLLLCIFGAFLFVRSDVMRYAIFSFLGILTVLVLNFFRDPDRTSPEGSNQIIAPADGRIVQIKELFETEYLKNSAVQVSIFMSPVNVHVNRFPMNGTVGYFKYIPGEYLVAFEEKSSERNERTHIGVENNGYRVLFKQIAGAVARRIVAEVEVGQTVRAGERFGMIKFGSRVDVIMPKSSEIKVKVSDRVRAGETILGTYST